MNKSEFYSEFLFRYQTDGAPRKISINAYCISEGVEYCNFIKWYRENKKRLRETEMEEIWVSPLTVTRVPSAFVASAVLLTPAEDANVVSFHLKLRNGIEINKEIPMTMLLCFRVFWQLNNNNKLRAINFKSRLRFYNEGMPDIKRLLFYGKQ